MSIARFFRGKEPLVLVAALCIVCGTLLFFIVTDSVRDGDTAGIDARIMKSLRQPGDLSKPRGFSGALTVMRDLTALGGFVVLLLVTGSVCGFFWITRKYHMMLFVLAATVGAVLMNGALKWWVDRPRPRIVPHLTDVSSASFPSGHSTLSAAVYLTLGGILAQSVTKRRLKLYFVFIALLIAFLVGASRVYLGVHYPTDVLAGWISGLVWSLLCWLAARRLQRRGAIEPADNLLPANDAKP